MQILKSLNLSKKLTISILLWILIGYLFALDLTQQVGCIIPAENYLTKYRLLFTLISSLIIALTLFLNKTKLIINILFLELLLQIVILLLYKGGYAVGFLGSFDEAILAFDLIGIWLRLYLISQYLRELLNIKSQRIILVSTIVLAVVILVIKAHYFEVPIILLN